jgi:Tol biopolymer transport system component
MTLAAGTRLGPYEIVAPLGAGGMGEVYRARDPRLGRDVAVKVLPQHLSSSSEVRTRFEREARTVSSLNHPNVCALFDVGREGDTDYLVMELVEGETLAARLARGALPVADVLRLGGQIADALDRAHRAGVIHRDLKPGNVMLTRSGAKLMDFGLARATGLAGPAGSVSAAALTQSPTLAQPLTAEGTLVGTFQYMSPEQLEGKEADARSDLWALGCVLYEMASGRRAFEGRSQASLISSIMSSEPPALTTLTPLAPPALESLVRACLAKDPDERVQTAHDTRLQLGWIADGGSGSGARAVATTAPRRRGRAVAFSVLGGVAAALAVFAVVTLLRGAAPAPAQMHLSLLAPENATFDDEECQVVISPDGSKILFAASDSVGLTQLWVRDLAAFHAEPLAGTQQASTPFWSPNSQAIGFFAAGKLKRLDLATRTVQALCDAPDGRGGAWSPRGVIVFSAGAVGGLSRVAEGGGAPAVVVPLDSTRHELSLRFPSFLSDGNHFVYVALAPDSGIKVRFASLDGHGTAFVTAADGSARYAAPGYLLYGRRGSLVAQRIDESSGRLLGATHVLGTWSTTTRYAGAYPVSVSDNGIIAQRHYAPRSSVFTWLDRYGRKTGSVSVPAAPYSDLWLSRDDQRLACARAGDDGGSDILAIDLARGLATPLTHDLANAERPALSPDGEWVLFTDLAGNARNVYRVRANGASEPALYIAGQSPFTDVDAWSPDGRTVLLREIGSRTGEDIWAWRPGVDAAPTPLLQGRSHEEDPSFSPDGRWIAYRSDESGRSELYVRSFPGLETKYRVSVDGAGAHSRSPLGRSFWRKDGHELAFVGGDGLTVMSAAIETKGGLRVGTPRPLFRLSATCQEALATSDLQRFLVLDEQSTKDAASIQLTLNWRSKIEGR